MVWTDKMCYVQYAVLTVLLSACTARCPLSWHCGWITSAGSDSPTSQDPPYHTLTTLLSPLLAYFVLAIPWLMSPLFFLPMPTVVTVPSSSRIWTLVMICKAHVEIVLIGVQCVREGEGQLAMCSLLKAEGEGLCTLLEGESLGQICKLGTCRLPSCLEHCMCWTISASASSLVPALFISSFYLLFVVDGEVGDVEEARW